MRLFDHDARDKLNKWLRKYGMRKKVFAESWAIFQQPWQPFVQLTKHGWKCRKRHFLKEKLPARKQQELCGKGRDYQSWRPKSSSSTKEVEHDKEMDHAHRYKNKYRREVVEWKPLDTTQKEKCSYASYNRERAKKMTEEVKKISKVRHRAHGQNVFPWYLHALTCSSLKCYRMATTRHW